MNISKAISDERMPAEQVSMKVIAELISRPQPMLHKDHPIRQIVDHIQNALPTYEMIEGKEIEEKSIYPSIADSYSVTYADGYHLDEKRMLRTQLSGVTLRAIEGKQPPLHFISAGRVFRTEQENEHRLKVFHQLDGICVERNVSLNDLHSILNNLLLTVLGNIEIRYRDNDFGWVDQGFEVDVKMHDKWITVAGGGILKPAMLLDATHNPDQVSGYAFGMGLERLAMLKLELKSIDELWSPCYLQPQT
jgi:phenylalanyl-tRNA synthetase alpha chain